MTTCYNVEFASTVRGGFPVRVVATVCPPEPDVGYFNSFVDELTLFKSDGSSEIGDWLKVSEKDHTRLEEEALEEANYLKGAKGYDG